MKSKYTIDCEKFDAEIQQAVIDRARLLELLDSEHGPAIIEAESIRRRLHAHVEHIRQRDKERRCLRP